MTCVLCGTRYGLEWRPVDLIRAQIAERYREGPFAWRALHGACDGQFCVHCLNHLRKRKSSKRKAMLPADQYLLGLLSPGLSVQVDMRSKKRLDRVMMQSTNPYRWTGVLPLTMVLESSKEKVRTWWEINLQSEFFHDRATARLIRQKIKGEPPCHAR